MVTVGNETLPNMTPEMQLQVPIFFMFYVFNLQPRIFTFSIEHLSFVIPAIKKASSITNYVSYYLNTHTRYFNQRTRRYDSGEPSRSVRVFIFNLHRVTLSLCVPGAAVGALHVRFDRERLGPNRGDHRSERTDVGRPGSLQYGSFNKHQP